MIRRTHLLLSFPCLLHEAHDMFVEHLDVRLQRRPLPVRMVLRAFSSLWKGELIEFVQELTDSRHPFRIKLVDRPGIHRHADATRLRVNTERRLQQMVSVFRDLRVEARIRVLQHDIFFGRI